MPGQKRNRGGGLSLNPCNGKTFVKNAYHTCRRDKSHLLHHSKYQRQHCDTKNVPALYWDPTEAEINEAQNAVS